MEPFESEELPDRELNALLREWQIPAAPAALRAAVFPDTPEPDSPKPWWRTIWTTSWTTSIRIPLPVACCLVALFAMTAWRWTRPLAPVPARVVEQERVAVPTEASNAWTQIMEPAACSDNHPQAARAKRALTFQELQPVGELRPRIIRSEHVEN